MRHEVSTSPSIVVGIVCWCMIGVAAGLGFLAGHLGDAGVSCGGAAIFVLFFETPIAMYGLLGGLVDWHLVRPVWRGIAGTSLNLAALAPVVLFVLSFIWR
jgi:hypothetical protein